MRNFSEKLAERIKTHHLGSIALLFSENLAVYEIMWKNVAEPDRPQMTTWHIFHYTRWSKYDRD
jgi:hypothetical protein